MDIFEKSFHSVNTNLPNLYVKRNIIIRKANKASNDCFIRWLSIKCLYKGRFVIQQ